jgi:hypothetical protein
LLPKTIQRRIDSVEIKSQTRFPHVANLLMDTTNFGKKLGVMLFKNSLNENYIQEYVKQETNQFSRVLKQLLCEASKYKVLFVMDVKD